MIRRFVFRANRECERRTRERERERERERGKLEVSREEERKEKGRRGEDRWTRFEIFNVHVQRTVTARPVTEL